MAKTKTPKLSQNPYKGAGKKAASVVPQVAGKTPKSAPSAQDETKEYVRVRLHRADQGGDWSILDIERDDHRRLLELIRELETMEAKHAFAEANRCKQYDMSGCPNNDAIKRLADDYQGLDVLVRFRLDGKTRVYGARERHEFHLMWWDSEHEVWPSVLKHT